MKEATAILLKGYFGALYEWLRDYKREKWNRDLPFGELLFDRWERARSLGFGEGASIYHNSYVYGDVQVGKGTWIGPFTLLDGSGGLTIGDFCSISAGVQIYTHDSVKWALSGGEAEYEYAPVSIGNCCYIGPQTVVAKGVSIGDGCVIGACSFVNRDIEVGTVAFGVPCRPMGRTEGAVNGFGERIERIKARFEDEEYCPECGGELGELGYCGACGWFLDFYEEG